MMDLASDSGRRIGITFGPVADRTHDGRSVKMLTIIDEYSRECLAIVTERSLKSDDVLDCLTEMFIHHGVHSL